MDNNSENLENWRVIFQGTNADIFRLIENAIMVAAEDYPNEYMQRRSRIAETLFNCKIKKCCGCGNVELALPGADDVKAAADEGKVECETKNVNGELESSDKSNEIKTKGVGDDRQGVELNGDQFISSCSYEDIAQALSEELEEDSRIAAEVSEIKKIFDNYKEEAESTVIESLKRLKSMALSVEILKFTDIAKSISALRKHKSEEVKNLVEEVVGVCKELIDDWIRATEAVVGKECTPESGKASAVDADDEGGLPSPPLDNLAHLPGSTEMWEFIDDMDDIGHPPTASEIEEIRAKGTPIWPKILNIATKNEVNGSFSAPRDQCTEQPKEREAEAVKTLSITAPRDLCTEQSKKQETVMNKPSAAAPRDFCTEQSKKQKNVMNKPSAAAPRDSIAKQPKEKETVMNKPLVAAPRELIAKQPKEKETVTKKPSVAAAQDWYTPQPKEQETVMKKASAAAPQGLIAKKPNEQSNALKKASVAAPRGLIAKKPNEQTNALKKASAAAPRGLIAKKPNEPSNALKKASVAAAPRGLIAKQPKAQETAMKKPSVAAAQDWYTPQPIEEKSKMKKQSVAATRDVHAKQQKKQEIVMGLQAVMKKPSTAAAQDWYTPQEPQPKKQKTESKKPLIAAASQDWYTPQPMNQETVMKKQETVMGLEAVMKKPSTAAAAQGWNTPQGPQPKKQKTESKKPLIAAAAQDWYTPQPKKQETVLKKPLLAAAEDWYTPQPEKQETQLKKPLIAGAQPKRNETALKKPKNTSACGSGQGLVIKPTLQQNKLKSSDKESMQEKLVLAKRKLQERIQEDKKAKKQRDIQILEMQNMLKQRKRTNGCL